MKKKLLLSLAGIAFLTLGLSTTKPVSAAETDANSTNQSQTNNTTSNTTKGDSNTSNTTDQSKTNNEQSNTTNSTNKPSITDTTKKPKKNNTNSNNAIKYLGKTVKLKRNAYIYDSKGKRIKNKKLKKGTILSVIGFTTVKNKSYLQISLNGKKTKKKEYVKPGNVKLFKVASYKVKRNAKVYDSKGKLLVKGNKYSYVKKGTTVFVYSTKKIKGKKLVGISETQFLKWSDLVHKTGKAVIK
ncbi:SLAP domain-containing protein [Lactobacillus sp. M0398]|uniref:SLAP domain-containing protein n=1 Tax=unclassified Lactobacillus TaxID=2620435 RepID=UPI0018DB1153|nr:MULTISPECIES: SLAP domain-containing protein [unclassified Lactobacillus]MBI0120223.1 SLAP domain-containing protein [Lactobacillus sp. M0398]MBI0122371.1 SLAP domain-containing protein [Lactobacillus sp. W8174]MBI0134565.1 SLAP domain-containing protein [Lactobacillus sp. W8173]